MKKITLLIAIALLLASVTTAFAAQTNPGGNITCEELGYEFSSGRINYNDGAFDGSFPAGISVFTDGTYITWSSTFGIGAVIVKGGNDANVYAYDPQAYGDSGLHAPENASGKPAGLSNLTFCWDPEPQQPQWCSPGYWRQPQHQGSWAATGYSQSMLFGDVLGYLPKVSKLGVSMNAPADPTLWLVLQFPQYYGGEAFNAVGDLLSGAHPDVNFTGMRVDNCPLGRAE